MPDLTHSTKCVLLDFDGPVCALFSAHPAHAVARGLERLGTAPLSSVRPGHARGRTDDPYVLLQEAFADPVSVEDGTADALERLLTEEEMIAAEGARPTVDADTVIRALHEAGHTLAVTTNNSARSVERYLARVGLTELFAGHVHGRVPGAPLRLKPDPDVLLRALSSTGASARDAVMVGDHPRDLGAALAAGVGFVGYARDARKAAQLREAGASAVAGSLGRVLELVDPRAHAEASARLRPQVA